MVSPVTRLTFRGVIARKWRIFLTILAVVSGVAFVSGAFVLTDSVKKSINDLFATLSEGIDLEVRTSIAFGDEATADRDPVLKCPDCSAAMDKYGYMGMKAILIDRCDHCALIWLDADELPNMVTALASALPDGESLAPVLVRTAAA